MIAVVTVASMARVARVPAVSLTVAVVVTGVRVVLVVWFVDMDLQVLFSAVIHGPNLYPLGICRM